MIHGPAQTKLLFLLPLRSFCGFGGKTMDTGSILESIQANHNVVVGYLEHLTIVRCKLS